VIRDFDFAGIGLIPDKADPPLIVYSYAVLALTIALQRLEPVGWNDGQCMQRNCSVQHLQLSHGRIFEAVKSKNPPTFPESFSVASTERPNGHDDKDTTFDVVLSTGKQKSANAGSLRQEH
jgi:hypothetical protein